MAGFYARPAEDRDALLRELEREALPTPEQAKAELAARTTVEPPPPERSVFSRRRALTDALREAGVGWTAGRR